MKRRDYFCIIIIVLTLAFIWGNSAMSVENSNQQSDGVISFLQKIFGSGFYFESITFWIRKMAHFAEFALLGAEVGYFIYHRFQCSIHWILHGLLFGLFVALSDESIQMLSGRAPRIYDVWIDAMGYIFGIVVILLSIKIYSINIRKSKKGNVL